MKHFYLEYMLNLNLIFYWVLWEDASTWYHCRSSIGHPTDLAPQISKVTWGG